MADPKIKYDIEAAVTGASDADELAQALQGISDELDGELQQSAMQAAKALEALGSQQRALGTFAELKRESQSLGTAFQQATATVDRMGDAVQQAASQTQVLQAAENGTAAAVTQAQASLKAKQDALRQLREETTGAARRTDEYRTSVAALKTDIKAAAEGVRAQNSAHREATQATVAAQNAEAALRKEYDLSIGSAVRVSAELRSKNSALAASREAMQGMGLTTTNLAQQERALEAALAEIRTEVVALPAAIKRKADADQAAALAAKEHADEEDRLADIVRRSQQQMQIAAQAEAEGIRRDAAAADAANRKSAAIAQSNVALDGTAGAYQRAAAASTQSTQVQAQNQRTLREGMTSISTQLQRIQQIATVAIGGGYFGGLLKDVAATADEFRNLEARVKLATGEGPLFQQSFDGVTQVALRTNSALDETGTLFTRLAKASHEGGMAAQAAQQRALGLTETINQSIQLSGGTADAAKAAITQLIQGLQSGVLRGEEFNSVMEQAPRLAQALANGLGVTTGELRKMAEQGALTSEVVMKSLEGQADTVAKEFGKLPPTVGRALQNLSTQWTLYVGESDKGLISSANAAKVIDSLARNLDMVVSTLTAAGKAWAAIKIAGLLGDFTRWVSTTVTATAALEANTAASVANSAAQRSNAATLAQNASAQTANTAATTANTAARAANARVWSEVGAFTRAAGAAQDVATAAAARNTAAIAANAGSVGQAGVVWRAASGLFGPWGLAVAALTPEILGLTRSLGEQAAKAMGWGKVLEDAERKIRALDEVSKINAESVRRQAEQFEAARSRSFDLTKQATGLIAEFDKLTKAGESTAEAVAKIGKDFDLSNSEGIRNASAALDKLAADGKISASELQAAWATALDGQDLARFEILARNAFAAAGLEAQKLQQQLTDAIEKGASPEVISALRVRLEGAMSAANREGERVAAMLDNVLRAAVQRTGLDFTVLQGRIGEASRSAINDLEAVIGGLDRLKAQGVDTGRVLVASFVRAIDTADSQKAVDAVTARVEQLRTTLGAKVADGLLDQAKAKALELTDALDKATPGVNSLREAMKQLGVTSDASLKQTATEAQTAYQTMVSSGKASARELGEGFKQAADAAIAANKGIPPSWVTAQAAVRGYQIDVDAAGRATVVSMQDAKRATDAVGAAARSAGGDMQYLAAQAKFASSEAQALAAAGQHLAAAFTQRNADVSNSSITKTQATTNPVDQVPTFNSRAEAEAWKKTWLEQYHKQNNLMNVGQLGSFMKDLTMFEFQKELDALEIREAMAEAKKKAEAGTGGGSGGGSGGGAGGGAGGGSGSGSTTIDRIVNVYIGNSMAYSVPTNVTGQQSIEAIAREVLRVLELQKSQLGI